MTDLLIDPDIQTELPTGPAFQPPKWDLPEWLEFVAGLLAEFLWVALIVTGVVILFLFLREMRLSPARKAPVKQTAPRAKTIEKPQPQSAPDLDLGVIDALAADGQFAEALHKLLAICDLILDRRCRADVLPSSTSRELADRARLPGVGLDAYRRIVRAVEGTRFGDAIADEPLYADARDAFGRFTDAVREAAA